MDHKEAQIFFGLLTSKPIEQFNPVKHSGASVPSNTSFRRISLNFRFKIVLVTLTALFIDNSTKVIIVIDGLFYVDYGLILICKGPLYMEISVPHI